MEQMIGVILLAAGGFSAASFYVPSYKIKKWSWETYWISLGFVAWMIMPTVAGLITTPDLWGILHASPMSSVGWAYLFGALWGFGGLMCGLALRYLGLSLGQSISLGVCAIVGTLVPAAIEGKLGLLFSTLPGAIVLLGFLVCLVGIALCGYAGVLKEIQLTDDEKKQSTKDFSLTKGIVFAVGGGIMSASMAFAFTFGMPIADAATKFSTVDVFKNMPLLVPALAGGFTTNFHLHDDHHGPQKGLRRLLYTPTQHVIPQLLSGPYQWHIMVRPMVFLRHRQDKDGRLQLRRLEHLHGRDYHLQQLLGSAA